jgi:hypothetical protein
VGRGTYVRSLWQTGDRPLEAFLGIEVGAGSEVPLLQSRHELRNEESRLRRGLRVREVRGDSDLGPGGWKAMGVPAEEDGTGGVEVEGLVVGEGGEGRGALLGHGEHLAEAEVVGVLVANGRGVESSLCGGLVGATEQLDLVNEASHGAKVPLHKENLDRSEEDCQQIERRGHREDWLGDRDDILVGIHGDEVWGLLLSRQVPLPENPKRRSACGEDRREEQGGRSGL